jgi:transposase
MLVELSVVEQRYQAVLAVIRDGIPVTEVASRFGVSRQAVHRWLRRYEDVAPVPSSVPPPARPSEHLDEACQRKRRVARVVPG